MLGPSTSSPGEISSTTTHDKYLLSCGLAWAVSLASRGLLNEEMMKIYGASNSYEPEENLLFR